MPSSSASHFPSSSNHLQPLSPSLPLSASAEGSGDVESDVDAGALDSGDVGYKIKEVTETKTELNNQDTSDLTNEQLVPESTTTWNDLIMKYVTRSSIINTV